MNRGAIIAGFGSVMPSDVVLNKVCGQADNWIGKRKEMS
jgi:hypothetical protein